MLKSKLPKYQYLQKRLKEARLAAGMTQVEVGKKFKQPQCFVSKIERGERNIDAIELVEIAKVYGQPIGFFLK